MKACVDSVAEFAMWWERLSARDHSTRPRARPTSTPLYRILAPCRGCRRCGVDFHHPSEHASRVFSFVAAVHGLSKNVMECGIILCVLGS